MAKEKKIGKGASSKYVPALGVLALIILAGALFLVFRAPGLDIQSELTGGSSDTALETLLTSQKAILVARKVLDDESSAGFDAVGDVARALRLADLNGLPPESADGVRNLIKVIESIRDSRDARSALADASDEMDKLLPELEVRAKEVEEANTVQSQAVLIAQLQRMSLLAKSQGRNIRSLASGFGDPGDLTLQMLEADLVLAQIAKGLEAGDPELGLRATSESEARESVDALIATVSKINENVQSVRERSDQVEVLALARLQLDDIAAQLSPDRAMASGVFSGKDGEERRELLTRLIALVMLIVLFMIWMLYRSGGSQESVEVQAENTDRNQAAIMRLLDELGSLADGDLTVQATVTEDITGAIADSINYAIEALRDLVATVNDSAIMVDGAAKQTDATAQQLAEAANAQSMQVQAASKAIRSMAVASEKISGNAERSSDVARHSVDVAHKGGDAVRRTIAGMNTIRETIQETGKRIKRLGESSQEIGDIVELINDIADQTNILALNASIQASMAGEAGRGFAVVADEVQRLAERSANATKQIEVLVRKIQTDTNEAVVSMERGTTDVVGGALLAENAGAALEEIEQVSNQIASLVQNISGSAREQAGAAVTVKRNMDKLQEINTQTAAGTSETTESIRKLAELSAQLRRSVAGFRLPAPGSDDTVAETPKIDAGDEYIMEHSAGAGAGAGAGSGSGSGAGSGSGSGAEGAQYVDKKTA
jgi:twitching motility protein PilJ